MTTLIIGTDVVQCEDCAEWYEVVFGHNCPRKNDPYRPSNIKKPAEFSQMRRKINRDTQEILDRCNQIKGAAITGKDGKLHTT